MDVDQLAERAGAAALAGRTVFTARLPTAAPFNDTRDLPEWSDAISAVESHGWDLQSLSIGQDHVIGVQGYLLFRRRS